MILVPLQFIRCIFCMNNEIQTTKGKIKNFSIPPQRKRNKTKKNTQSFQILTVKVRFKNKL